MANGGVNYNRSANRAAIPDKTFAGDSQRSRIRVAWDEVVVETDSAANEVMPLFSEFRPGIRIYQLYQNSNGNAIGAAGLFFTIDRNGNKLTDLVSLAGLSGTTENPYYFIQVPEGERRLGMSFNNAQAAADNVRVKFKIWYVED